MPTPAMKALHSTTFNNKTTLAAAGGGVCLACKATVSYGEIDSFIPEKEGYTAVCPHCGVDCVALGAPDKALVEITSKAYFS